MQRRQDQYQNALSHSVSMCISTPLSISEEAPRFIMLWQKGRATAFDEGEDRILRLFWIPCNVEFHLHLSSFFYMKRLVFQWSLFGSKAWKPL